MHAARVVADHSADRATIMRRRIGSKPKPMRRSMSAKIVQHDAGPRSGQSFRRIDCEKVVKVFGHIQNDRHIAALARETRAAAARKYGRTVRVGGENCLRDVFDTARQDDPNRHFPVVRSINGVKRAGCLNRTALRRESCREVLWLIFRRRRESCSHFASQRTCSWITFPGRAGGRSPTRRLASCQP
jgi:hypothetical protein